MVTNYFKSNNRFFFFTDTFRESIEDAYKMACVLGIPSIYRPTFIAGPWDASPVIGHRHRTEILRDLSIEKNADVRVTLTDELLSLYNTFLEVGRLVPLRAVAA